jgi:hypothetical protein
MAFPKSYSMVIVRRRQDAMSCRGLMSQSAVFDALKTIGWRDVWTRVKRSLSDIATACDAAVNLGDHPIG